MHRSIASLTLIAVVLCAASVIAETDEELMTKARDAQNAADKLTDEMMRKMNDLEVDFHRQKLPVFSERNKLLSTIKGFWPRVIENHPSHTAWFRSSDKDILQYLRDVQVQDLASRPEDHGRTNNFRITMTFDPNPYFSDSVLFREISGIGDDEHAKVSGIKWTSGKQPSEPSFFNFFEEKTTQPFFLDEHHMADIGHVFRYEFWPNPFTYHDLPSYDDFVAQEHIQQEVAEANAEGVPPEHIPTEEELASDAAAAQEPLPAADGETAASAEHAPVPPAPSDEQ